MIRFVARETDLVVCLKHAIGTIGRVDREVLVNGKTIAAVGDAVECMPVANPQIVLPNYDVDNRLMAGAAEVLVGGRSVVGMLHATQHNSAPPGTPNGMVIFGSADVLVGGNTAVGNVADAVAACEAANETRKFKGVSRPQSYDNCGCESMRQLVNGKKGPYDPGYVSEDEYLNQQAKAGNAQVPLDEKQTKEMSKRCKSCADEAAAVDREPYENGAYQSPAQIARLKAAQQKLADCQAQYRAEVAQNSRKNRAVSGGTNTDERNRMGDSSGVPTQSGDPSVAAMVNDLGQGKGIVAPTSGLPNKDGKIGDHIVVVAGVVLNDKGEPVEVIYNDSVAGCNKRMDADEFQKKLQNAPTNVTKNPVW